MIIYKEITFDMAHLLEGHAGACRNVHGHTYKLEVGVEGELIKEGSSKGMVMDFKDIKKGLKQIKDQFDHTFVYNDSNEKERSIGLFLKSLDKKVHAFDTRTTCEEMSRYIYDYLRSEDIPVVEVKLWETPTSYAVYKGEKK